MAHPFPLESLRTLAQDRTDAAARQLGALLARERHSQEQLAMIEGYADEYRQRFHAEAAQGMKPYLWDNYARFMQRIDRALGEQKKDLAYLQHQSAEGQRAWLAQHQRLQAYEGLAQRHRAGVQKLAERQAQKLTDEHAARRYAVRAAA